VITYQLRDRKLLNVILANGILSLLDCVYLFCRSVLQSVNMFGSLFKIAISSIDMRGNDQNGRSLLRGHAPGNTLSSLEMGISGLAPFSRSFTKLGKSPSM
jgi:hypothetical protein